MCFPMKRKNGPFSGSSWWLLVTYLTLQSLKIVADLSDIIDVLPVLLPQAW